MGVKFIDSKNKDLKKLLMEQQIIKVLMLQ